MADELAVATAGGRSDNPAVELYRKTGFVEERRVPLRRLEQPGMVSWVKDESLPTGEPSLVTCGYPSSHADGRR